jgi:hypothetical protein
MAPAEPQAELPILFLGPVMPDKNEVNRVTGYSVLLVQAHGAVTKLGYADRATARQERRNLLKAKNVYPVPTARLLAAIAHALQQVSPKDTGHGPGERKDDRRDRN